MVLDGSSFSFHVTFTDGTSISASGNNAFPKNQRKVFSELNSLIAPVVEQWYQEQYPKMIEDNRINGFSFYVCSKDQAQKFGAGDLKKETMIPKPITCMRILSI